MINDTITKQREPFFDNARVILIFLVVLGHFVEPAQNADLAPAVRYFIYLFHMPAFVFISGSFFNVNDIRKGVIRGIRFLALFLMLKIVEWVCGVLFLGQFSISLFDTGGIPWFLFAMAVWSMVTPILLKALSIKVWLIIFFILALVVGYDTGIGSYLVISRIIVFWPFFLAGMLLNREKAVAFFRKKSVKILGILILLLMLIIVLKYYDQLKYTGGMLSGQNAYSCLGDAAKSGFLVRLMIYGASAAGIFAILAITPGKRYFFTPWGERTIAVYFYDYIIYYITVVFWVDLHLWQYILLAVGFTVLLSQKVFYIPFKKILK